MSTVKTNNVQIGQSVTATNNFTWYQPATPDGTVRLGNGNSGSVTDLVTLTSAGNLGIGTSSPGSKLDVNGNVRVSAGGGILSFTGTSGNKVIGQADAIVTSASSTDLGIQAANSLVIATGGTAQTMKLDSSGNLGLGGAPTSGAISSSSLQVGGVAYFGGHSYGATNNQVVVGNNCYVATDTSFRYGAYNDVAAMYRISAGGIHQWQNAPSGTAGNAISFTQAMTLDASGNLGVGTSSPGARLDVYGSGNVSINSKGNLFVSPGGTAAQSSGAGGQISFGAWLGGDLGAPYAMAAIKGVSESSTTNTNTGALIFATAPQSTVLTERARIDSSGNLLVGKTAADQTSIGVNIFKNGTNSGRIEIVNSVAGGIAIQAFYYTNGSAVGSISCTNTATAYNTSSDLRLKENIVDAPSALDSINSIKIRSFDWKADRSHVDYGYIAQELLEIVPEAVSIPADPEEMMGVDFGRLTPRLVKAIQELSAELNELKQKVNA